MSPKTPEQRVQNREYWARNREAIAQRRRKAYLANREKINARNKASYQKHREERQATNRAWAEAHPEAVQEIKKRYKQVHRDEVLAKARDYAAQRYKENPEEARAKNKAYHAKNREQVNEKARAFRAANRERLNEKQRQFRAEHPERDKVWRKAHPEVSQIKQARRRAHQKNATINDFTKVQWQAMKDHYGHKCAYCQRKMKRLTMDHLTPISKGGNHTASNIVPACLTCNIKKRDKEVLVPVQPLLFAV